MFNEAKRREIRRDLRHRLPPAEAFLWTRLRAKGATAKFRRQHGIGPYVVDFYCPEVRLAIEIDGPSHDCEEMALYDAERQREIEELGVVFLRFSNREVYRNVDEVARIIAVEVEKLRSVGHTRAKVVAAARRGENVRDWPGLEQG